MPNADVARAAERVSLACRALSAAANDLHVARQRDDPAIQDGAHELEAETERVCELAAQLSELADSFRARPTAGDAVGVAR
jgi:hypothetical protein